MSWPKTNDNHHHTQAMYDIPISSAMLATMALSENALLRSYILLHQIFPEDLHIARPLIQMLQKIDRVQEARSLALSMARRMLASGKPGFTLAFLALCKQLNHPDLDEIESLSNMARINSNGHMESERNSGKLFTLIEQLSDSEALDFIGQSTLRQIDPGEDIVTQGERSETFYLILDGEVDVRLMLAGGEAKNLKRLLPGDFFGEFACVYKLKRSATVTASTTVMLLEFSGQAINQLMQHSPLAGELLIRTVQARMVHATTHTIPAFSELPEADKLWAAEESTVHEYGIGELIPSQESTPARCQIMLFGEADVHSDAGQIQLRSGDIFGTVSPYIQLPPNAQIRARQHALVCEIPENIFHTFMNVYATFEQHVKQIGDKRQVVSEG